MTYQFNETVGVLLAQVCRQHRQNAETALNTIGLHTGQEFLIILLSEQDGLTQNELAEIIKVQPPTISKMLARLGNLIERRPDKEDARISRVYLTDEGRKIVTDIYKIWQSLEERTTTGLSLMEQALLRRLLMQLLTNLQD
jgi:MarR family transcriptional regulator, organic hydroperoxide resistance regulator